MKLKEYMALGTTFMALKPTLGQIWNTGKYAWHYFNNSFPYKVTHTPLSVGFVITYKCNRSCEGCYIQSIVKQDSDLLKMDMDIERFIEMLSHKAIKNSFRVPLIGGEPLLHKNFFDFVEIAAKHKKLVYTFTNGLLLEKNLDSFANASLDTLRISLYDDVLDEQKHNIRKLLSINPKFKVYLSTWTTPFKLDALERAVEIALELGVSGLNIQNYMPHTDGKDLNELAMLIWEDDTKTLEKIKDIKKEVAGRMSLTLPVPIPRKSHPKSCICLNTMLYLDRRGLIVPCPGIWPPKPEYGNLLGKDGWNSPFMVDFRENFDKKFPYNHVCKHCFWGHGMIQKNSDFLLD